MFNENAVDYSPDAVANAPSAVRADFIVKTYTHLTGAVMAFASLLALMIQVVPAQTAEKIAVTAFSGWNWLLVLGAFMLVSTVAERWARSSTSVGMQYAGLSLFVVAEALLFFPMIYFAARYGGSSVIPTAGLMTLALFAGLTAIVFVTKEDFSFLRGILMLGGLVAIGLIVCSALFGFNLGTIFTVAMIGLMCGYILYHTSNVLHHYAPGQHVAASLALFASLATLFWYVLRLVMSRD